MNADDESDSLWAKVVVAYFKVSSQSFLGELGEKLEKLKQPLGLQNIRANVLDSYQTRYSCANMC
jgi:hypothetical protein